MFLSKTSQLTRNMMNCKSFFEKNCNFFVLVHFAKGVENGYMYLNFKFYFGKVGTHFCEKLYDPTHS